MADGIVRRINDEMYFVLDEVGESSDNESELISNNDAKEKLSLNKKGNVSDENDNSNTSASKTHLMNTVSKNENSREESREFIIHEASTSQNKSRSPDIEKRNNRKECLPEYQNNKISYKHTNSTNLNCEDSSAIVDMEIDSDTETTQQKIKPLIRVTFRDESIENLIMPCLHNFLSCKLKNCTIVTNSENELELEVYDNKDLRKDDLIDFDLDTTPGDNQSAILYYGKNHDFMLTDTSPDDESPNTTKNVPPAFGCFNCLGNHNLRNCPEPKDYKNIKNRLKIQMRNKMAKNSFSRYHLDENQKFCHLIPGVISKKLRQALNLHRDQQPAFIYRMRLLGYPPAWLEEAKISHSGVAMYDSKGDLVLDEDEEEGQIISEESRDKYDITKIIDFPGFNVPLPKNMKDESKFYSCPAISESQSKEALIKELEPKTAQAYVKKSLTNQKFDDKMEDKPLPDDAASSTIEELVEKKRQLLMELNYEDSASETKLDSDDSSCGANQEKNESNGNVQSKEIGSVKNLELGTPILKSVSPFSKLPSREQFSVNVSDIINFENLPNSTGKYEAMRHVITKIRVSAAKLQSES